MSAIKKAIFWAFMLIFLFTGFWMVIVNNDSVSLNLLFTNTGPVNAGFVIFMSLTVGAIVGFIAGSFRAGESARSDSGRRCQSIRAGARNCTSTRTDCA